MVYCTDCRKQIIIASQLNTEAGVMLSCRGEQIGSLRVATDGTGNVVGRFVYTAFGEPILEDGGGTGEGGTGVSPVQTRYKFGGAWQYETGLGRDENGADPLPNIRIGHRWYDPETGRFLQRDPIGIAGGLNTYAYCDNLPTLFFDPYGLDWWNPFDYEPVAKATLWLTGGCGHVPVMDPGKAQDAVLIPAEIISLAAPGGALIKGTKWLPRARGIEWTLNKNFRIGWHRLPSAGKGARNMLEWAKGRNLPHVHRRGPGGIGAHWPWQPWP